MAQPALSAKDLAQPKLEALVEMMFLAAYADEELGDEERKQLASSVETLTDKRIAGADVDALVTRVTADLARDGREERLASVKSRLADVHERQLAFELAVRVMAADGIVRTSEREMILEVADALEIDRDKAADLVAELTR